MASIQWQRHCAAVAALVTRRDRAWRMFMRRTTKLAAIADRRTGGNECLCRNWGNEDCNRIWAEGWKRWRAYSDAFDIRYSAMTKAGKSIA